MPITIVSPFADPIDSTPPRTTGSGTALRSCLSRWLTSSAATSNLAWDPASTIAPPSRETGSPSSFISRGCGVMSEVSAFSGTLAAARVTTTESTTAGQIPFTVFIPLKGQIAEFSRVRRQIGTSRSVGAQPRCVVTGLCLTSLEPSNLTLKHHRQFGQPSRALLLHGVRRVLRQHNVILRER